MMIREKHLRAYLREWCRRNGVDFSRKVWLVRRHAFKRFKEVRDFD